MKIDLSEEFGGQAASPQKGGAPLAPQTSASAPTTFRPVADALVLVCAQVTCTTCQNQFTNVETRTFLRVGSKFSINRLDSIFSRELPREIKILQFPSEYCLNCFSNGDFGSDFIKNSCKLVDPVLSSLNASAAAPLLEDQDNAQEDRRTA